VIGRLASSRTALVGAGVGGAGLGIAGGALAAWFIAKAAEFALAIYCPEVAWSLTPDDLDFLGLVAGCSSVGGTIGGAGAAAAVGARHVGEGWKPPTTPGAALPAGLPD